jgi:hypothetical protein
MRKQRISTEGSRAFALGLALVFFGTCCMGALSPVVDGTTSIPIRASIAAYSMHNPIVIEGDEGFTAENGVVGGSGVESDPYVVSGWEIDMDGQPYPNNAVWIVNTTAAFVVTDLFVHGDDDSYARGVFLVNVTFGTVHACRIDNLRTGIGVQLSSNISITQNRLIDTDCVMSGLNNATFARNEGYSATVRVSASSNVSIAYNEANYSLSENEPRGFAVEITYCNRCIVLGNTLWTVTETDPRGSSITLYLSTNCSVHGNAMNDLGISIDAHELMNLATHDIGQDNTVKMLPLKYISNTTGVVIDRAGFGQLIVANCTDVRLQDLSVSGLRCPVGVRFCSDVEISDCTFTDMSWALDVQYSSDLRLRHNMFVNGSEVWTRSCSGLDFSDNDFVSSSHGSFYASGLGDSTIEDNRFEVEWGEVSLAGSKNLSVRNNLFSLGGLRVYGHTASEFDSHIIDLSNLVGGKSILYLKNEANLDVDLSNNSQLILASCSGMDVHGMRTSSSNAIQMGFSEDITVHDCNIYGSNPIDLSYADDITFYENDFVNPGILMSLTMTHNVTTYHCNIMGTYGAWSSGGFDNYTPTNILWDNGYPDGGNYWERCGWTDDNYSGPNQDVPGADGMWDRALGAAWWVDRYPLVAPYVHDQWVAPEDAWQDATRWLSAIAIIVATSSLISYLLFVREGPRKPGQQRTDGHEEP